MSDIHDLHAKETSDLWVRLAEAKNEIDRLKGDRAEMLAALQAVVSIADRKTVEFDMARAAIEKATETDTSGKGSGE